MGRGRERVVRCEKCGRQTRRDKAVFYEKVMFTNPVERKDVFDDQYTPRITKTVPYCASCGKHLGIYEKKIKHAIAQKERAQRQMFSGFQPRNRPAYYENPDGTTTLNQPQGQKPSAPAGTSSPSQSVPAEEESEEIPAGERGAKNSANSDSEQAA